MSIQGLNPKIDVHPGFDKGNRCPSRVLKKKSMSIQGLNPKIDVHSGFEPQNRCPSRVWKKKSMFIQGLKKQIDVHPGFEKKSRCSSRVWKSHGGKVDVPDAISYIDSGATVCRSQTYFKHWFWDPTLNIESMYQGGAGTLIVAFSRAGHWFWCWGPT